jgi:hypothetical protein
VIRLQGLRENSVLRKGTASAVPSIVENSRGLQPLRASFCQRIGGFRGRKKRTSAAKAGYGNFFYGTAEAVKFQDILYRLSPDILYTFLFF